MRSSAPFGGAGRCAAGASGVTSTANRTPNVQLPTPNRFERPTAGKNDSRS